MGGFGRGRFRLGTLFRGVVLRLSLERDFVALFGIGLVCVFLARLLLFVVVLLEHRDNENTML